LLNSGVLMRINRICIWSWNYALVGSFLIGLSLKGVTQRWKLLQLLGRLWMWFMCVILWGLCIEIWSPRISCLQVKTIKLRLKLLILDSLSSLKRVSKIIFLQIWFSFYFIFISIFYDFFFFFKVDKGFSNLCGLILTQLDLSKFFFGWKILPSRN